MLSLRARQYIRFRFYDGRFRPKVVPDKKVKEQRKSKKHKNRSIDDTEG